VRPLLIVKAGTTLPSLLEGSGDFEDWILAGMGPLPQRVEVARVCEGEELPDPGVFAGVVVTGSSAMLSDREPWSERTAKWLAQAVETPTPVLGICYGHQLLAHGLGGRVGVNPRGREIGTVAVRLQQAARHDRLLGDLPDVVRVQASHVESVLELPAGARLLASTAGDPHHAFAIGTAAWGVQFHPEFDAEITRAYIESRRQMIRAEGLDPELLLRTVTDCPRGTEVLRCFSRLLRE
jgi:GMP synthase (glutamine-hydrolysing)